MCSFADIPNPMKCEHCGGIKLNKVYGISMIKSTYEQNGRHATKVNFGGKSIYRSKTKENYEKTGDSTSQYTNGYKEHMKKKGVIV